MTATIQQQNTNSHLNNNNNNSLNSQYNKFNLKLEDIRSLNHSIKFLSEENVRNMNDM